jgi:hypothetical protein
VQKVGRSPILACYWKRPCTQIRPLACLAVVAVGSRDVAKSQAFIDDCKLKDAVAYGSYQEVLDDPNVEAVYVPLPTSLHVEWVTKAAAKGKHVMLEKPIALVSAFPSDRWALWAAAWRALCTNINKKKSLRLEPTRAGRNSMGTLYGSTQLRKRLLVCKHCGG